jgi:hypothetical protein
MFYKLILFQLFYSLYNYVTPVCHYMYGFRHHTDIHPAVQTLSYWPHMTELIVYLSYT